MKGTLPVDLVDIYLPIAERLEEFEAAYKDRLNPTQEKYVRELVKHVSAYRGKRLRPALVFLAGEACGTVTPGHLHIANAIEAMHVATLVHDDILDEAALRRKTETANVRWGNEVSVLLGDFLFSRAFVESSRLANPGIAQQFSAVCSLVCEGELLQIGERHNPEMTAERYLRIIELKTASLTSFASEAGAILSGASPDRQKGLAAFGRNLGIAFQIADDCLDIVGDERVVGKSLGTDLVKGKVTLPLVRLLSVAPASVREKVAAIVSAGAGDGERELIGGWLQEYGCLNYASEMADRYVADAVEALQPLATGRFREAMEALAQFVTRRTL